MMMGLLFCAHDQLPSQLHCGDWPAPQYGTEPVHGIAPLLQVHTPLVH